MELSEYFRFLLALVFVIGLIAVLAVTARRIGFGSPTSIIKRRGERRLEIVEVLPIEGRRKLMLVRSDDKEHLLMVSPTSELLIETKNAMPQSPSPNKRIKEQS